MKFVQAVAYHSCLNIIATTCKYVSFTGPVICLGISCLISNEWSKDYRVWNEEWSDGVLLNLQTFQQFHVSFLELICKSQSLHPRLGATCVRSLVFSQRVTQWVHRLRITAATKNLTFSHKPRRSDFLKAPHMDHNEARARTRPSLQRAAKPSVLAANDGT